MKFMKLGSKPDAFLKDGKNIRTVATELAPDLIIHIGEVKFYLHKFPLLAKSARLQRLLGSSNNENTDEINIPDIPGGPAAFEICAKFCYGMTVTLNAYNVIAARCAAEYLDMNETVEKGNIIHKIEVFLNSSVLRGWKDSIIVLQTTKALLPWSEDLKLVARCIDSIASKVSVDPSKVDWSYTYNRKKLPSENGHDPQWNGVKKEQSVPKDWWVEDLCDIKMEFFKRIVVAVKAKGRVSSEVIGEALKTYTYKRLSSSKGSSSSAGEGAKNRAFLETIISLLPKEKGSVSCGFLLKLLRGIVLLDCGKKSKKDLIERIGQQLEDALVPDLLIPSTTGQDTVYDIDVVTTIVEEFMMQESSAHRMSFDCEECRETGSPLVSPSSKVAVAKLVDGYLAEVAKDRNLPLSKFIRLAEMVAGDSRPVHDGLYRAIDMYLKEHQGLSKGERKRLCRLLDCRKLSMDACMHAVQNDRLPLRLVVQVLFEQMRASTVSSNRAESGGSYGSSRSVVTTNTEDECVAVPKAAIVSERSSSSNNNDKDIDFKMKGMLKSKILSELLLSKSALDTSSSDTSESPGSANLDEPKLTPSRTVRYS